MRSGARSEGRSTEGICSICGKFATQRGSSQHGESPSIRGKLAAAGGVERESQQCDREPQTRKGLAAHGERGRNGEVQQHAASTEV